MNVNSTRQYTIREIIPLGDQAEVSLWHGKRLAGLIGRCNSCGRWVSIRVAVRPHCVPCDSYSVLQLGLIPVSNAIDQL